MWRHISTFIITVITAAMLLGGLFLWLYVALNHKGLL